MNITTQGICALALAALGLAASSAASADVHVIINPFGFVAVAPPVVYEPQPYYAAPPMVYAGRGYWGDHRGRHSRRHGPRDDRRR